MVAMHQASTRSPPSRPTVLVVDDEEGMRALIARMLTRSGYPVLAASNGLEALARMREARIDVVVTDLSMPEMNGLDLIDALTKVRPETTVIGLSGMDHSTRYLKRARLLGARASLRKPVGRADLVRTIERLTATGP